jgi:hypothetical protein
VTEPPWFAANVFCGRGPEECDGIAEPEEDDHVRFFKCTNPECGFEFGFQVIEVQTDGTCQIGVPEEVRRRGISLAHLTSDPEAQRKLAELNRQRVPVFIETITRRAE